MIPRSSKPHIIVTMAGGGRRFRDAGYDMPKFMVTARGRTLFDWSMTSLSGFARAGWRFIFIAQREDRTQPFLQQACPNAGIDDWGLVELDGITDGQATTVLTSSDMIGTGSVPIGVYNIDTYVEAHALPPAAIQGDGWIPCFPGQGDAWSFARTANDLRIVEVREKNRISPHCTIGFYYFRSFDLYRQAYGRYYGDGANLERGERYIAPLYNQLIKDGLSVYMHPVPADAVHPLGTPAEVERFVESAKSAI